MAAESGARKPEARSGPPRVPRRARPAVAALPAAAFAVLLLGGYGGNWRWTGFGSNASLWDWLHLLILPVALALLPLWLKTHRKQEGRWWALGGGAVVAFAVLVVGGYAFGWRWTGFQGNTLWDWLQLLLVPFVLPAVIVWVSARTVEEEVEEVEEEVGEAVGPRLAAGAQPGPGGVSRARAIP